MHKLNLLTFCCLALGLSLARVSSPAQAAQTPRQVLLLDKSRTPLIVIAPTATASEKFAAQELANYLGKIGGRPLKIETTDAVPKAKPLLIVGHHPANADLHPEKLGIEESVVDVSRDRVRIVGGMEPPLKLADGRLFVRDRGTLYGVYNFLDELGVRWYRPEAWGEFVPKMERVLLAAGRRTSKPAYTYRQGMNGYRWWADETEEQRKLGRLWATRNRQNTNMWTPPEYGGYRQVDFSHSYMYLVPHAQYFKEHPEYFALIGAPSGSRKRSADESAQLCLGNKEVQNLVAQKIIAQAKANPQQEVFSLEPNDMSLWCQCELCRAMDDPNLKAAAGGGVSMANRVAAFNNIIAKRLAAAVPGAKVGWLAYNQHTEVPTIVKALEPNTLIRPAAYAGAYSDYSKKLRDPASQQNARFLKILEGYGKLAPMSTYEYWSGYAWYGPLPTIHVMTDRLREYRKLNVTGVYNEIHPSWGPQGIDLYFFTRLLWNPDIDVQKELDLYYKNYYGPAAVPLKAYHELIEKKSQGGPVYYSGGYNLQHLFNTELVTQLGQYMGQAQKLVKGQAPYDKRVEGVWAGYEYVRRVNQFFTLKGQGKLVEAAQELNDLETFILSYKEGDVFDNGPKIYPSIIQFVREFGKDIKEQTALLQNFESPRIAQLHNKEWRFQTDAGNKGIDAAWFAPTFDDAQWPLLDADKWWQDQGYSNYHGVAWYRRRFKAPTRQPGQRVILYFGAVDGDATVYVNGKEVGQHLLKAEGAGWDKPFYFDITEALVEGQPNLMVVRVKKDNYMSGIYKGVQILVVDRIK